MTITQLPPLSLYIHTPWCVQKCPYCDFNSHQLKTSIPESDYIQQLLSDLENDIPQVWGRQLVSIFIGGGTPSLLSPTSYEKLFSGIRALIPFHSDIEITMEANPGTVEADKFKGFYDSGINRISIGVQSFDDQFLLSLGRIHTAGEAEKAFEIARNAGFKNINIDLMYALPKQSIFQAMSDLSKAIALNPEHLSWYQLTLEPNTLFYHQPPPLPDDELIIEIAEQGLNRLEKSDYQRYEVSAFSRSGQFPSVHNLNYWQFGDYLGIGAGAHSKITRADTQTITRKSKKRHPKDYLAARSNFVDHQFVIPNHELPLEFMMNALRLKDGFDESLFFARTGLLLEQIAKPLNESINDGLLERHNHQINPTSKGYDFLNETLAYFMPKETHIRDGKQTINIKNLTE